MILHITGSSISKDDDRGNNVSRKRSMVMKLGRSLFGISIFFIATVMVPSYFLQDVQAFRGERGDQVGRGEGEGEFAERPRGGRAAEGPRGGAVAEGPRDDAVVERPRDDSVVEGPYGGVVARGPQGNVYVGRAVGDRVAVLPDPVNSLTVGDQTYYLDDSGFYYQPCDDDNTVYCVVPGP
jgi:hypothetical protein